MSKRITLTLGSREMDWLLKCYVTGQGELGIAAAEQGYRGTVTRMTADDIRTEEA